MDKLCTGCDEILDCARFSVRRASKDGLSPICKSCKSQRAAQYHKKNKDKVVERVRSWRLSNPEKKRANQRKHERKYNLKKLYGITPEEYEEMLAKQGGLCAVCRGEPYGRGNKLHVDHDHATGRVRGLLCHGCNASLGLMKESPERLRSAAVYLER